MKLKSNQKPSQKQRIKPLYKYALWTIALTTVAGVVVFVSLNIGRIQDAFAAATYNSTTAGGNWATGSTWVGGASPGSWGNNTANILGNVTLTSSTTEINGFNLITLNNGKSFTSGSTTTPNNISFQNVTFNVISGNITVYGNLTLNSTALTITTGNLAVTGTLTLTGNSTLVKNGTGTISAATVTSSGSGGTLTVNSGTLSATTSLSINSSTTVTIATGATLGAAALALSNNGDAILNNNGTASITGNVSQGGTVNNNGTMVVNGSLTSTGSGSSVFTNMGSLSVGGDITLPSSGKLYTKPGSTVLASGNVIVGGNQNLVVGTNVAPPPYADMVIKKNLVQTGSGDVLFDRNARVAIFGNVTDSGGGGTLFTVNNGGQVYIDGDITYTGGGNSITNNNTTNPYGFYVNGVISNTGGGSTTTANKANKTVMQNTNAPFYNWVMLQSSGPLPIKLLFFKIAETTENYVSLVWATAVEENFDKFEIQRSSDGKTFETIAEVKGNGNTKTRKDYTYEDSAPLIGKNYYKLKSVDLDNTFDYSGVVLAEVESSKELSIYPNPSNGEVVNYRINFEPDGSDIISIIDFSGSEVKRFEISGSSGQLTFDTKLKPGTYVLKYSSTHFQKADRLIVR